MLEHVNENPTKMRSLSPWNPLDHLRLLWWVLVTPQRLVAYREAYGENAERNMGKWLTATLWVLPYFILVMAEGLGTLPQGSEVYSPIVYIVLIAGLVLVWVLTGRSSKGYSASRGGTSVVFTIVFLVAYAKASIGLGLVTGMTARAVVYGIVQVCVVPKVKHSLETGHPSWLVRGAFGMFLVAHAFLVWLSFFGGWRVFV